MKELISPEDVMNATNLHKFNMKLVAKIIMQLTGINAINQLYSDLSEHQGIAFVNEFFEKLNIDINLYEKELRNIPKSGPFVIVANHPLGAIDGLMLIKLIAQRRPDFKVMANFLLKNIQPIEDFFIPVNPFEDIGKSSISGMKAALEHMKNGGGLGIFPAGEVSSYQTHSRKITDREWQKPALKLIKHAKVRLFLYTLKVTTVCCSNYWACCTQSFAPPNWQAKFSKSAIAHYLSVLVTPFQLPTRPNL